MVIRQKVPTFVHSEVDYILSVGKFYRENIETDIQIADEIYP